MFELDRLRTSKKIPASIGIGALTLAFFAVELALYGMDPSARQLLQLGASEHDLVWREHQLWRLLCPAFLHGGLIHIAMNGYSFAQLAPFVEKVWGSARFLVVYVVSAIAGAALSSGAGNAVSVGASGALFGLMGFLVAAAYSGTHKHEVRTIVSGVWGQGLLISGAATLFYGFSPASTHIDNMAHIGGLLAGGGLGLLLVETEETDTPMKLMGGAACLAVVAAWVALGLDARHGRRFEETCSEANIAFEHGDFDRTSSLCEQAIALEPRSPLVPRICLLEGVAHLRARHFEEATYALERAWRNEETPGTAALLAVASALHGDAKGARRWGEEFRRAGGAGLEQAAERLLGARLDDQARAAVAAVSSG
jgi:membrane associated rhomboid family serine protease